MESVGLIERAFELAPLVGSLKELKQKLMREGYVGIEAHFAGPQIKRDLKARLGQKLGSAATRD